MCGPIVTDIVLLDHDREAGKCECLAKVISGTAVHVSEKNRGLVYDMLARGPGVREDGQEERKKQGKTDRMSEQERC